MGSDGHVYIRAIWPWPSLPNVKQAYLYLQMPRNYKRKQASTRGSWSQDDLRRAVEAVKAGSSVRNASEVYNIPRKTLERRVKINNDVKGKMGFSGIFSKEQEHRLVRHVKEMQNRGFPLTISDLRSLAYHFAIQLDVKHSFNQQKEMAGYDWVQLFLRRNSDLSLRKAEGISLNRVHAMNHNEVQQYFNLLTKCLEENNLFNKPGHIFNMDETGLQLNNRPGIVLAEKGSRNVCSVTSTERGETITLITCCNAEGNFLPPACVMKGKLKKNEYTDNMPPGSKLYMSQKSAYVNSVIFLEWLTGHFLPRKPEGKVLLILDGHASHSSSVEMLEICNDNDVILLCLPSHTTHYLQPLDRTVFKSLKSSFYDACRLWLRTHPGRRITRYQFGELLNSCWGKSANPANATAGFRASGIYPLNPGAIPDYAYSVVRPQKNASSNAQINAHNISGNVEINNSFGGKNNHAFNQPSTSNHDSQPATSEQLSKNSVEPSTSTKECEDVESPFTKTVSKILPSPDLVEPVRKRAKKIASILTSPEVIEGIKSKLRNPKKGKAPLKRSKMPLKKVVKKKRETRGMNFQAVIVK